MKSYFKEENNYNNNPCSIPFSNKAIEINILKNYFKQPKSIPKKRSTFSHSKRPETLNNMILNLGQKQT